MERDKKPTFNQSVDFKLIKKVQPNCTESEKVVLGWLVMYPDKIIKISEGLARADFYDGKNAIIYGALCKMASEGKHIDLVTLSSFLEENAVLDRVGGASYVAGLMDGIPKLTKIEPHVDIIKDKARLRKLIQSSYDAFQSCYHPGVTAKDIASKLATEVTPLASGRDSEPNRILSRDVRDWVKRSAGEFSRLDIRNDMNLIATQDRHNLSMILLRLEKDGLIVKSGKREGHYRRVESDLLEMEWENADTTEVPVEWPLDIHKFYITYKKSINVIAGKKSEGKTLFCLDFAHRNVDKMKVHYLTNELGPQGVKVRTGRMKDIPIEKWKKIHFYERTENYEDAIFPNDINIIDYLEVGMDFWQMGHIIRKIHKKLVDGIAVIAMQKKEGATYGIGGEFTTHAAQLYLTLDVRTAKIIYAKNIRDGMNSYDGKVRRLKIVGGAEFVPDGDWGEVDNDNKKMRF